MAEYKVPEAYSAYLDQLNDKLLSKTETIKYDPVSPSALKSAIQKALRPGYDKAIQNRQQSAATNRAAIDADAAARGVGASTWVTDVKNRQNDAAARDIAGLEGEYSSEVYKNLLSKLSEQDQMSMTAQQFNATAKQNALAQALANTNTWYEKWKKEQSKGSGSTRNSSPVGEPSLEQLWAATNAKNDYDRNIGSTVIKNYKAGNVDADLAAAEEKAKKAAAARTARIADAITGRGGGK